MARVRTTIAVPGTHAAPQGPCVIDAARCRHWAKQFAAMKASGIRTPVPWGHQVAALPVDPLLSDARAYGASRFNAGYVDDLAVAADGSLVATLDVPGVEARDGKLVAVAQLPNGSVVSNAIAEVSPAVGGTWTDGKGRTWNDILAHVALVTRPVQAGQAGFHSLARSAPQGFLYLGAIPVDDEKDDDTKKPGQPPDPAADLADDLTVPPPDSDEDGLPDATDPPPGDPLAGNPDADRLSRVLAGFAEMGLGLPPDTDPGNFLERLDVALGVLKASKAMTPPAPPPSSSPAPTSPPQPERPPTMMLATKTTPTELALMRRELERSRASWKTRLAALRRRNLPVHLANRLEALVGQTTLSLDGQGGFAEPEVERLLAVLEEALPADGDPMTLLASATPVAHPGAAAQEETETRGDLTMTKSQWAEIEKRAERQGRKLA